MEINMKINNVTAIDIYKKLYKHNLEKIESLAVMKKLTNIYTVNTPMEIYFDKITRIMEIKYNVFSPALKIRYNTIFHNIGFSLGTLNLEAIEPIYDLFQKYFINMPESHYGLIGRLDLITKNNTEEEKLNFLIEYIDRLYQLELTGGK
jgi:hypothetical protein